jgi:hypothetical protein
MQDGMMVADLIVIDNSILINLMIQLILPFFRQYRQVLIPPSLIPLVIGLVEVLQDDRRTS